MNVIVSEQQQEGVRRAIEPLVAGIPAEPAELADSAAYSRFHFHRVFKRLMGETPGEMRRRLLLERAAWLLVKESASVSDTAFEAGFESLEGFSRAFKKAFGVLPSGYASAHLPLWLPTGNGVHYSPLALVPIGGTKMDFIDRLVDHDLWITNEILKVAKGLTDEQLDAALPMSAQAMCYEDEQTSIRSLIDMILFTKEVWIAAVEHQGFPENRDRSAEGLTRRAEVALPIFAGVARRVRDAGEWDTVFVDDLCEEPVPFSFGGMIMHVFTTTIYRRLLILEALRRMGVKDLGYGDPLEWEQALAKA